MAKYKITDPQTGKTVTVSGSRPPNQQDAESIFNKAGLRAPKQENNIISKVAGFVTPALKQFSQAVTGSRALKAQNVANQNLMQQLQQRAQQQQQAGDQQGLNETLQKLGNVGIPTSQYSEQLQQDINYKPGENNLAYAARTGAGVGLEAGSYLATPATPLNGLKPASKIGQAGLKISQAGARGAQIGALSGASRGLTEGEDVLEKTLKGAGTGAATGAVLQTGIEGVKGISSGFQALKNKGLDTYATTFKDNKSARDVIKRLGGPKETAKKFVENKIPKTKGGVIKELEKMNGKYEDDVTKQLEKITDKNKKINLPSLLKDLKTEAAKRFDLPDPQTKANLKRANDFIDSYIGYADDLSPVAANELRKKIDKAFTGADLLNIPAGDKWANDMIANKLRGAVQESAPITKKFFNKYSLLKSAEQIFYKEPKVGFNEIMGALAAGATVPGSGLVGAAAARVAKSPGATRGLGTLIEGLPRGNVDIPEKAITDTGVKAMTAIERAIARENEKKQQKGRMLP